VSESTARLGAYDGLARHVLEVFQNSCLPKRSDNMKKRLLLIDDDEELLATMTDFFRRRDYEVECASEAEEAVAMVRHHRFSVVIADLELNSIEGLDGFGVLKAARQSCPKTKVIVYSGYFDEKIVEAVLRHGGAKFLAKPAPLSQLFVIVEEQCQLTS
jgi:DNA-binding NtrC family response regulator